jgi:hypothetical protein
MSCLWHKMGRGLDPQVPRSFAPIEGVGGEGGGRVGGKGGGGGRGEK